MAARTCPEFLEASADFTGPVFEQVHQRLVAVDQAHEGGTLIVDPLATKVLFKNGPTFCILDVKTKWVAVGFSQRRRLELSHRSGVASCAGSCRRRSGSSRARHTGSRPPG